MTYNKQQYINFDNQTNTLRYEIERFTTVIVIMLHVYTSIYRVSLSKNDIIKN